MHYNWIPADPFGQIWRLVCYVEDNNPNNYAYFLLAEVKQIKQKRWKWKLFTCKTDNYPVMKNWGYTFDRYDAIDKISHLCKIA